MDAPKPPPVINPDVDVAELLRHRIAETGTVEEISGGFRIHVQHNGGFPWGEVCKLLLYRDFKVHVTRQKADLFIEAYM